MTALYTETYGAGKQTIILVHGWAMHCGIMRAFAQKLAEKNYRVICVDLPGHGRSQPITPFNMASISAILLDALPTTPCCWVGWSLGAEIVVNIAKHYPDRVNKLVLLAGTPCFVKKQGWPGMAEQVLDSFAHTLQQDAAATLFRFLALQIKGEANRQSALQAFKALVDEVPAPDASTLQAGLMLLKHTDLRQDFARLTMPVAAILGELDRLVPVDVAGAMQQLLSGLHTFIIQRSGHVLFLTHDVQTMAAIQQFIDRHVAT